MAASTKAIMNRLATPQRSRRPPVTAPRILIKLDLADENQRRLHALIQRFHTGRWPLFRALGMRQIDGVLVEAVQWLRMARRSFCLVSWQSDGLGLCWVDYSTREKALTALRNK